MHSQIVFEIMPILIMTSTFANCTLCNTVMFEFFDIKANFQIYTHLECSDMKVFVVRNREENSCVDLPFLMTSLMF